MVQNRLRLIQWDEVMTVLLNMLVGAMAALGLILLLWLGFAALLAPMPKSCVHIVPLRGGRTGAVIRAALRRRASGDRWPAGPSRQRASPHGRDPPGLGGKAQPSRSSLYLI